MKGQAYRLGYRADLEGLRAIAILLVIAVHAGVPSLGGGFVGVDIFFVLSGFLISGLIVQETSTTGRFSFTKFYVRRLRRLMPALLLMLLTVCVVAAFLLAPTVQRNQSIAAAMAALWLSNIHFALAHLNYFSPDAETNLFLHTWTLGVEEQFYLLWPVLLVWLLRPTGSHGTTRLKFGMFAVALTSFAACVFLTYAAPRMAFYMMPLRAWQFAAGALLWLYLKVPDQAERRVNFWLLRIAGWIGLAFILIAVLWLRDDMPYPGFYALLPTLGAAGVIAAGCDGASNKSVSRLLSWWPLQWIGHISYSWYLWHWPVLLLGVALVGSARPAIQAEWVLVSFFIATISFYCLETPIRNQKLWLRRPGWAIFGALSVMILVSSLNLDWYASATREIYSPAYQRFVKAHMDAPVIYEMGCDEWYYSARVKVCAFGSQDAQHTAVLLGDSHAGQWFPAVAQLFDRPNWRLLVITKSSCPMVDEPFFYTRIGKVYKVCAVWRKKALAQIAKIKPDIVLISSARVNFTKVQWINGTAQVLNKLSPVTRRVFIIRDTPHLAFDGPDCLAAHVTQTKWLGKWLHTCESLFNSKYETHVYQWLQQVASRYSNVRTINMNALICPHGVCSATQHGTVVFRDSQHLTRSFAAALGYELGTKLGMANLAVVRIPSAINKSPKELKGSY